MTILSRPVNQRASFIAFSFASAPPFVKNDIVRSPGRHLGQQPRQLGALLVRHHRSDRAELVRLLLDGRDSFGCWWPNETLTSCDAKSR